MGLSITVFSEFHESLQQINWTEGGFQKPWTCNGVRRAVLQRLFAQTVQLAELSELVSEVGFVQQMLTTSTM